MATTEPTTSTTRTTRAQRAAFPLSAEVAQVIAEQHGVCVRPLAMRRIDTTTGRVDVVPVPCGSTRDDQCRPCADKARRLRMAQCREGWHLETEPVIERAKPAEEQTELMAARADLFTAYAECRAAGDEVACEQIAESVAELDEQLRMLGVRGRLTPLDSPHKPVHRSTRRRQDAPNLPRRPVERRTVGRVFAGRYRPSTFLTLTLDSYGQVDSHGAAVNPEAYDYRRAAWDAIHFAALVDRFWQNTRRCVGWDVQYFGTVEPQKRGAPHFHAAIRGAIPRAELRAIAAATYHQVWWPPHDDLVYGEDRLPVWDVRAKTFTDPGSGRRPLPTWDQACAQLTEPAHVVRFGTQVHIKGILGGTEEAGRHIGYLTKYLTKSIDQAAGLGANATDAQRDHAQRLHAALQITPCSPRCPVWLLYGVQPKGARHSMSPGRCKGKAHKPEHLGVAGRRVLVSRKWSNKTLDDHRAERGEFVRQLLERAGIQPAHGIKDGPYLWERPAPADPDVPPRPVLLLHAIAERQRWKAEYTAAQLATSNPPTND
ncbi:MAG: replication initiator protein, partial [Pseudonocardia sp.]|nr:replication initiator protein [Pseudonocardia sp.]